MCVSEEVDSNFLNTLAKDTENYTGADLDNLCREAGLLCLRENIDNPEVRAVHFLAAKSLVLGTLA